MTKLRVGSFFTTALLLAMTACTGQQAPVEGDDDKSDSLKTTDGLSSVHVLYDFAYIEVEALGAAGAVSLSEPSNCPNAITFASGLTNEAVQGVAWAGEHVLRVEGDTTELSVVQRPIPGCGDDAGSEEPTEADLEACASVMELLARADCVRPGLRTTPNARRPTFEDKASALVSRRLERSKTGSPRTPRSLSRGVGA